MQQERRIPGTDRTARGGALVALVAGAVATALLAGCSPSSGGSDGSSGESDGTATVGPLDSLLDTVAQGSGETSEAELARLQRSEEIIAACMTEQGFEYAPTDWRARGEAQPGAERDGAADAEDPEAFAAEHGYGIFAADAVAAAMAAPGPAADDPNAERLAAMSPTEEQAWYLALWGPGQGEDYDAGREPYDWTKYGCGGRAAHETGSDEIEVFDDSPWQGLRDQIAALEATVLTHSDLADAQAAWAACMEEAGYPGYVTVDDPVAELTRRAEEIWTEAGAGASVGVSTEDDATDPASLQIQEDVTARSAEMFRVETELAAADYRCRAESGFAERASQVWLDVQEEFYEAHRADLDAWLAAYEEYRVVHD